MKKSTSVKKEQLTPELKALNSAKNKLIKSSLKDFNYIHTRLGALRTEDRKYDEKFIAELNSLIKLSRTVERDVVKAMKIEREYKKLLKSTVKKTK